MDEKPLSPLLESLGACPDARRWATGRGVDRDAYRACNQSEWLIWLGTALGLDPPTLVAAACRCARLALPQVQDDDGSPLRVIEAAEAYARGEPDADSRLEAVAWSVNGGRLEDETYESYSARQSADRTAHYAKNPDSLAIVAMHAHDAGVLNIDLADAVREVIPFEAFADAVAQREAQST